MKTGKGYALYLNQRKFITFGIIGATRVAKVVMKILDLVKNNCLYWL